jgi:hypothetical protein
MDNKKISTIIIININVIHIAERDNIFLLGFQIFFDELRLQMIKIFQYTSFDTNCEPELSLTDFESSTGFLFGVREREMDSQFHYLLRDAL